MAISKHKIDFVPGTPADNDRIGSFLVSLAGNVITDTSSALDVYINNASIVVTATALDIRALTNADVVTAEQGTSPWVVSATDLDVRDLAFATDSVTAYQGTSPWVISGTVSLTEDVTNGAIKNSAASVSTIAQVLASPLAGRTSVIIQNLGDKSVYLGFDNTATAANGLEIPKYSNVEIAADANAALWMIAASGTQDVRFLEIKK